MLSSRISLVLNFACYSGCLLKNVRWYSFTAFYYLVAWSCTPCSYKWYIPYNSLSYLMSTIRNFIYILLISLISFSDFSLIVEALSSLFVLCLIAYRSGFFFHLILKQVTKECLDKAISICAPGVEFKKIGKTIQ